MIVEAICNLIKNMLFALFSWINLPDFPDELLISIDNFFDVMHGLTQFIGFFLPGKVIVGCSAIWLALFSFERSYPLILWIIRKIPISID